MTKYIIGIDPDSSKHGVAIYKDSVLEDLLMNDLMSLMDNIVTIRGRIDFYATIEVHIENVCGQNAAFAKKGVANSRAGTAVNRSVGKCQQAQLEVERLCEYLGVPVVKHGISKQWKDANGKKVFERVTGWTGRSNEDSRSAAFMGYLGVTSK